MPGKRLPDPVPRLAGRTWAETSSELQFWLEKLAHSLAGTAITANETATTVASGDITGTNDSGWVDDGTVVRLETDTDQVVVGGDTPTASDGLEVQGSDIGVTKYTSDDTDVSNLILRRSRGTAGTPVSVSLGDDLGTIQFHGTSTTDFVSTNGFKKGAEIVGVAGTDFFTDVSDEFYDTEIVFRQFHLGSYVETYRFLAAGTLSILGSVPTSVPGSIATPGQAIFGDGYTTASPVFDIRQSADGAPGGRTFLLFKNPYGSLGWAHATEEVTITAATNDTSANLPASTILAVKVEVTETITRATTDITNFDVGTSTSAQRFAAGVSRLVSSNTVGYRHWRGSVTTDADGPVDTATPLRITCNGGSGGFTAGKVRVTWYFLGGN